MKHEIKISEINRVEALLSEVEKSVTCNGSDYVKQFLINEIAKHQFGSQEYLNDLKTQLNWVRSNEG